MFIKHKIKKGEDFKSVMRKYKLKDWKGVWNLKGNTALRRKRKFVDKVEVDDTLVLFDGTIKYHSIKMGAKTYLVSEKDWAGTKKKIIAELNTKFLTPLGKIKKTYDDDFEFLQSLANDNAIAGFFAALVEDLSGAKLPTAEMGKASAAIRDLQKKILAGKFAEIGPAGAKAQAAMDAYAKAAETYRTKMTNGATKGVKAVKFVDDYAFIVVGAIATGGASAVVGGTFTVIEIGAAVGAGTAFLKASSSEIGKKVSGEDRSAQEISFSIYSKMLGGGLEGAIVGKLLGGKMAAEFFKQFSAILAKSFPRTVTALIKVEAESLIKSPSLLAGLGKERAVAEMVKILTRTSAGTIKAHAKKVLDSEKDILASAIKSVLKAMTGKESEKKLIENVAKHLAASNAAEKIARSVIIGRRKVVISELEKIDVDA